MKIEIEGKPIEEILKNSENGINNSLHVGSELKNLSENIINQTRYLSLIDVIEYNDIFDKFKKI